MIQAVFQNNDLMICYKPPEVLSVPGREKNDPRPCLGTLLQKELKTQVFPVHRLDYEVGGLIIYALNSQSHRKAQEWFTQKKIRKYYSALTGRQNFQHWPLHIANEREALHLVSLQEFEWKSQILRGKRRSFESPHGEWAETKARVESADTESILWRLYPVTGKPHQLRFEMSKRGFPIHGDTLYGGSEAAFKGPGIALRAYELDLKHVQDRLGLPEIISIDPFVQK